MPDSRISAGALTATLLLLAFCVTNAQAQHPTAKVERGRAITVKATAWTLEELVRIAQERNPALAEGVFAIDAARGRTTQAGLYLNPVVSVTGDELGDRQGPGGIWTAPYVSQEIVTGGKLRLSKAAASREIDQATLDLAARRYNLLASIRQAYYEVLFVQRKQEILSYLVKVSEQSVEKTRSMLEAKIVARLDVLQMELELERFRAEQEAVQREIPATFRKLAGTVGVVDLPFATVLGTMEFDSPDYDLKLAQDRLLSIHPSIQSARLAVDRANLLVERARVEPIPNVTVGAGYVRQNQNKSDDWVIGVSLPLPIWNRNQGNIHAAQAAVGEATAAVGRIETELVQKLATAYAGYASARKRADNFRSAVLPRAQEVYKLSLEAYKGGQFEYLRVLQAQRAIGDATLEYNRALADLWRNAAEISGLLLEEDWPVCAMTPPVPRP